MQCACKGISQDGSSSESTNQEGQANGSRPSQVGGRGHGRGRGRGRGRYIRGGERRGQYRAKTHRRGSNNQLNNPQRSETSDITCEPFVEKVGPNVSISARNLDIFKLFFTTTLIDLIVEQTNLCASQVTQYAQWSKVTAVEIWAYFGFMILMGINHLPALADYWKLDPTYRYSPIANRITRDRFLEITRYLHFVDNTCLLPRTDPNYDKLGKIRPIIDHLSHQLLTVYNPHREASIDEAMVAFKGRSSMKQYVPKKPVKRGF